MDAVALHVSYSQSDCREFITIVQREVLRVGSVGGSQKEPTAVHASVFSWPQQLGGMNNEFDVSSG